MKETNPFVRNMSRAEIVERIDADPEIGKHSCSAYYETSSDDEKCDDIYKRFWGWGIKRVIRQLRWEEKEHAEWIEELTGVSREREAARRSRDSEALGFY